MTQSLICYGTKTQSILEKLNYEVNGIKLLGCSDISQLGHIIKKSGSLQSIFIFESALDKGNLTMPSILIENKDVNVIFILDDKEIMNTYDIEYYQYDNIYILNNNGKAMTLIRLKELISKARVDDDELYKGDNIEIEQEEEPITQPTTVQEAEETQGFQIETEDEQPVFDLDSPSNGIDLTISPEREISLEQDTPVVQQINTDNLKGLKEKIKDAVKIYNGLIIFLTGTPKSYTTTTVFNLARYISSIDQVVGVIDLDNYANSGSTIMKKVTKEIGNASPLTKAMQTQDMLTSGILIDTNFQLFANNPLADGYPLNEETVKNLQSMLLKNRKFYDVILIDCQLKDLNILQPLAELSSKIIFNIGMNNKDLLLFMRLIETIEEESFRNRAFESTYIEINPDKNKLLDSKFSDIRAIDSFLEANQIVNEKKYEDIYKLGTIMKTKETYDTYGKNLPYNEKEIERIFANLLNVK